MAQINIVDLPDLPTAADDVVLPVDSGIQSYKSTYLQVKNFILGTIPASISTLTSNLSALTTKQYEQKLIQIVATQRTFKTTAGDAGIVASDSSVGALNAWISRNLNNAKQTDNSSSYFVHDSANSRIQILRPGSYEVYFESHAHRTNYWQLQAEYRPPSGAYNFKQVQGRTATGSTAVGNEEHTATSYILDIPVGREGGYLYLQQYTETNTTNFRYGQWYCLGTASAPYNYVDTCTLKVTLIEE